jgi:hypothetical protein
VRGPAALTLGVALAGVVGVAFFEERKAERLRAGSVATAA